MTDYFCDTGLATGSNDGTTMDDAWQSIETAFESATPAADDIVWIRRRSTFSSPSSDIAPSRDGSLNQPQYVIGWPRNTHAVSSSDWTNGSATVTIDDNDMDREQHCGRFITGPDGFDYLITRVISSSSINIDREYAGSTETNQAATIVADEDYTLAQAIDDSAWTIKKTDWNGDNDDLPQIDFGANAYNLYLTGAQHWKIKNLEILGSTDTFGTIWLRTTYRVTFIGCLISNDNNTEIITLYASGHLAEFERCIITGSGSGAAQVGITPQSGHMLKMKDCAIYNCGDYGIGNAGMGNVILENVNIGVEQANGDDDIFPGSISITKAVDLKLGGTNGDIQFTSPSGIERVHIENYQKVLGDHKTFYPNGEMTKTDVVAGSGDPYKRTGGADSVIGITGDNHPTTTNPGAGWEYEVFTHEFEATTDSKSYRYYVQCDALTLTAAELFLECEYVDSYDDTSEYTKTKVVSDETCSLRSSASDWTQYIEVTGIQPAVASKVRITCKLAKYDADGTIYIDPLVVIS